MDEERAICVGNVQWALRADIVANILGFAICAHAIPAIGPQVIMRMIDMICGTLAPQLHFRRIFPTHVEPKTKWETP